VAWSFVTLSCTFLDEILVSFGALHLEAAYGATPGQRAMNFAAYMLGGIAGTSVLEKKTTAAEMGEAVMAICEATTATDSGLDGRMLFSLATSVMTGIVENAVCPVPAMRVMR
jgi:hypothetical protein